MIELAYEQNLRLAHLLVVFRARQSAFRAEIDHDAKMNRETASVYRQLRRAANVAFKGEKLKR